MKQEDKDLLFRDLCSRLPYRVKISTDKAIQNIKYIDQCDGVIWVNGVKIENIKPYLFHPFSLTEEQKDELVSERLGYYQVFDGVGRRFSFERGYEVYDWLNKNHFDYRGLIEKGLAIDATNLGIYK